MRARWLSIALAVSVALNLFCLGFLSARAFQRGEGRAERPRPAAAGRGQHRPRQRPRPFEWMTEAERDELRPRRRALRASRRAVEEALRAEPFEREALTQALGELRRQTDDIQASVHELMLRRAAGMSGDERRRMADSQWQRRGRGGR